MNNEEYIEPKPILTKMSFQFSQEGNTLGTTSSDEYLDIDVEYQLPGDEGGFFVLKTKGWSINDENEIKEIIQQCRKTDEFFQKFRKI